MSAYPWHDVWIPRLQGTPAMQCGGVLMLPEQATLRTTGESQLYCLSCKGLVNAGDGQYDLAREAAKSEDFDLAAAKAAPVDSGPVVVIAALGKADPKPFTGDLFPGIVTTKKRRK